MNVAIFHSDCYRTDFSFNVLGLRLYVVFRLTQKPGSAYGDLQDFFLRVPYSSFELLQFNCTCL